MSKSRSLLRLSALLAAALGASPALSATTFFNNFDSTNFGAGAGFVILPSYEGWTAVAGPGIEVQYNNVAGVSFSGPNHVELDSSGNSAMERAIDAGDYLLTFYYSARPNVPSVSNGIDVLVNGVSIFNVTGNGGGTTNWVQQSVAFSLAAPGTLRFAAIGTSDSLGGYLDNVNLAAVPEPASWAMMIAGFGLLGGVLRRRQTPQAVIA